MKVEINDKFINLDKTTKDLIGNLKKEIRRLNNVIKRREEKFQELSWKADEYENAKEEVQELKDKIKEFFKLGED